MDFIKHLLERLPTLPNWTNELIILGCFITRFADALKYHLQARKIVHVRTAKSQSRVFIVISFIGDIFLIAYAAFVTHDPVIFLTTIIAMICIWELFIVTYLFYDYRHYPCTKSITYTRPNIFIYIWNSILPNSRRKHL